MNYQEMSDEQINDAVAVARGYKITEINGWAMHQVSGDDLCTDFCNSWADAGPVIHKNAIGISPSADVWHAYGPDEDFVHSHQNPLRAAMIVFLMMKEADNAN